MSGNHTVLIVAALVLFSIIVLNTNRNILYSTDRSLQAEYVSAAVSIGQRLIKEISSRAFDQNTVSGTPDNVSGFSSTLGPETGETFSTYNDIDDFDGYTTTVNSTSTGSYTVASDVDYVVEANPSVISLARTRTKRITVRVYPNITESGTITRDTVTLNYYSSY